MKTTSLELSKQLKNAGYPQDNMFSWYIDSRGDIYIRTLLEESGQRIVMPETNRDSKWLCSAPTADEILDRLPAKLMDKESYLVIEKFPHSNHYEINYRDEGYHRTNGDNVGYESLVEAAGKLWLYLKENNLL